MTPAQRYARVVKALAGRQGVTYEEEGKGFGASSLKVGNRIFAMLASGDEFVVKLPRERVEVLVAAGEGDRFDPRRNGKLMKEWLVVASDKRWLDLAEEALEFVASKR